VNARLVATALSDVLGQQVIVENRSGAAGTIGTASVARAAPDGYTLLLADITFLVGPNLFANLKYDPLRDFAPVVFLSRANMLLAVTPSFPAKTVSDLVAMAKQRPGELQYVNPGSGTPPHSKTTRLRFVKINNSMGRRVHAVGNEGRLACCTEPMLEVRRQHESD